MYRLGSVSKPITAVAAMQLYEHGKLDIDAPVRKYVPAFPRKQWPVTTRLLLGHLGGVRHYKGGEIGSTRHYTDLTEALAIFKDDPLIHKPGTQYSYTTYGYNLVGAAVESAAGMPFLDYVKSHVFAPAGMRRIRDDDVFAVIPHRSRGYTKSAAGRIQNAILADISNKIPGGGLISTAEDLVRFAIAVERATLVSPKTRDLMFTSLRTRNGAETGYGLGWQRGKSGVRPTLFHGGSQPGCRSLLTLFPEEGLVVAIMTNSEHAKPPEILDVILKTLLP